jgi:predicted nucleic acid-binding protein
VLTGKAKVATVTSRIVVQQWADSFDVADSTWAAFQSAFDLTVDQCLSIWDALIPAVTAENRCRLLLTEDLHHDFTWRGVTVINPYRLLSHPLLSPYLT